MSIGFLRIELIGEFLGNDGIKTLDNSSVICSSMESISSFFNV